MIELSLEQGVLAAFGLIVPLAGWMIRQSWLRQKEHLAEVQDELNRLRQNHDALNKNHETLNQNHAALNQSLVGMGKKMKQMSVRLAEAEQRAVLAPVEEASFQQASRLVSLGASARDLIENCGMGRAEAELMVSMRRRQ